VAAGEQAVGAFLDKLNADDRVAVIRFSEELEAGLQESGFTENKAATKGGLRLDHLSPKTYLNDMIWRSAALLEDGV
jgi:hypothetical protein